MVVGGGAPRARPRQGWRRGGVSVRCAFDGGCAGHSDRGDPMAHSERAGCGWGPTARRASAQGGSVLLRCFCFGGHLGRFGAVPQSGMVCKSAARAQGAGRRRANVPREDAAVAGAARQCRRRVRLVRPGRLHRNHVAATSNSPAPAATTADTKETQKAPAATTATNKTMAATEAASAA